MGKKNYIHNVVLIMSGGVGSRFGADKPKQYCAMKGKPVIEYALDACRLSTLTDEIVIVTTKEYEKEVKDKYGFPTTCGGETRTESLANGLAYVAEHYVCEKVIVANAVCPLMTEEQIDKYFRLLDEYDYVLTAWKVVSTLHRYDGQLVDRNDYFHVMEPEAYHFPELYQNYKKDFPVPYIFHQLPKEAKGYYCFDYPYTMKLTYPHDLQIAEIFYDEMILKPKQEKTKQKMNLWLSSFGTEDITAWMLKVPQYMKELVDKWEITSYVLNPQAFSTCVYEARSEKYGDVIVKFHSPGGRFQLELLYYQKGKFPFMAELLDYDTEYRVLLIKKIKPGIQVKFHSEDRSLEEFYRQVSKHKLKIEEKEIDFEIPSILSEFEKNVQCSSRYAFDPEFKRKMEKKAREIWEYFFADSPQFFLHRDLHRRNILRAGEEVRAIDPQGIMGPEEFEYIIPFIIEIKAEPENIVQKHDELFRFFSQFCEKDRLYAAEFFLWIHKMDEYIFTRHDNFKLANWTACTIKTIFFEKDEWLKDGYEGMPKGLRKIIKKMENDQK